MSQEGGRDTLFFHMRSFYEYLQGLSCIILEIVEGEPVPACGKGAVAGAFQVAVAAVIVDYFFVAYIKL